MKLLFDTNIWIRYILKDNLLQFEQAKFLIDANETGLVKLYSSSIIFLELSYVLKTIYHFKFEEILDVMEGIRRTRNIIILQDTDINQAINYYKTYKIKFSDCLIASQLEKDIVLTTFDLEFKKIKEIKCQTPKELLATLSNTN